MFGNLSGPTLLVILFIVLLLFGAPKLPGLAKSLGQSMRILKKEVRSDADESATGAAKPEEAAGSGTTGSAPTETPAAADTTTEAPAPKKPADGSE
ncbi:twin-arginine translocase TatA/TatE family subunit [Leucobacter luti]|uniref:Sec-independent protein translocase protein TatA n=1 Tax=Leucobacter luti TaxID=340320 RepID=A0A4Q7U0Q9_9MICO|nr:twin-arginine translocase TatA/TatE family subunit [Leucobacter luti]MBL3698952.1 twin-arginine translocase TatA/TatE family subunit [Leucobacter luti]RZT66330.1 sec-independent protein translocase protein TatA [Leucobacter luti]